MKARFLISLVLLILGISLPALGNQRVWGFCSPGVVPQTVSGLTVAPAGAVIYPGCTVTVYLAGTTTLATGLASDNIGTALSNPFSSTTTTGYWEFYPPNGKYDVVVSGAGIVTPFTYGDIIALDSVNVSIKPAASDAYYYAAQSGNDTTGDGLSKGTAFATPQKCISTVIAKGGGTCDARTLYTYTSSTEIDVGDTTPHCVTLLVPPYGTWTGTMTDGTSYVLKVFGCSAVIGTNSGLGQQFVVEPSASAIISDVCGTPSAFPRNYVRMEGFSCIGVSGATINTAVLEVQSLVDESYVSKMVSSNHSANGSGKGLYIHNICCGATVRNVASNSNSVSGGVPCTIGSASDTDADASIGPINCTSPGTGRPALAIVQNGGSLDRIHDVYTEENGTDTTTPVVQVTCPNGASISPDYLFGFTEGAAVGGETRYSVDVASTCAMVLRDIQTGPSGNAINDHNAGRTPLQPGSQAIVAQYDTNNGVRTLSSYFSVVNAFSSVKLFSSSGGAITLQAPVTASPFTDTLPAATGNVVVDTATQTLSAKTFSDTITSSLATGTPPLTVTSTTPVAHLTAVPTTYNAAGAQQTNLHIVEDSGTLTSSSPSTVTITLTGSAAFTSSSSYNCSVTNKTTQANPLKITYTDGSHFVVTGPNTVTDSFSFVCVGN